MAKPIIIEFSERHPKIACDHSKAHWTAGRQALRVFLRLVLSFGMPLTQTVRRRIYVTLIRRHGAGSVCQRFACAAIEQFVQVGLLPECDARQNNAGKGYELNDKSKRLIASHGRVEIDPESCGGDQVNDSNDIAQIFVTHKFVLKYDFLSMRPNIAVDCVGIVNKSVRSCGWLVQKVRRETLLTEHFVTRIRLNWDAASHDKFCLALGFSRFHGGFTLPLTEANANRVRCTEAESLQGEASF